MNFHQQLNNACERNNSHLCVGIDPIYEYFPKHLKNTKAPYFAFSKWLIDQTAAYCSAFKFQAAYFSAAGEENALARSIQYIKTNHPNHLIILDAKRGDIGSTAMAYKKEAFERYEVDAVTLNPYIGLEGLQPFLETATKGAIVVCRTSNGDAHDIQSMILADKSTRLYLKIASLVNEHQNDNAMLVVGATQISSLKEIRKSFPSMPLLIPGVGVQGGSLKLAILAGIDAKQRGFLIPVSRLISLSEKPAKEASNLQDMINDIRNSSTNI